MIIIGHRGARGLAPENTLVALRKGLEHGVDELEFDLRVTKDKIVILHHDPFLTNPDDDKLIITDYTYKELKAQKPDLATFSEVIKQIGTAKAALYIEVKPGVELKEIIKLVHGGLENGLDATKLRFASFSQPILLELQQAFPDIQKIVIEKWSGVRATHHARQLGTKRIAMNQRWLWWGFVSSMSRSGYQLTPYTINSLKQAKGWKRYGLYGVVTDYPDRFDSLR
jgi:glycerophosphoryl diester phosphodiesterase